MFDLEESKIETLDLEEVEGLGGPVGAPGRGVRGAGRPPGVPVAADLGVPAEEGRIEALQRELGRQQARHLERIESLLREQEARLVAAIARPTRATGPVSSCCQTSSQGALRSLGSVFSHSASVKPAKRTSPEGGAGETVTMSEETRGHLFLGRQSTLTGFIASKTAGLKVRDRHASQVRQLARQVHEHKYFEASIAVVIIVSACALGWHADWSVKHIGQPPPVAFTAVEYVVILACTAELAVRLVDEGQQFFNPFGQNFRWNVFDSAIVFSSWGEELIRAMSLNVAAMRTTRLLRLARVLRILRVVRFFRELRLMIKGILACLKPFLWCMSLLLIVMFCAGMVILQALITELTDNPAGDHAALLEHFGGIGRTMYTLYLSVTGGINWGVSAAELSKVHPAMIFLYSSFVGFSVLCLLNIVTGLFVEYANEISKTDADNMVMEELSTQEKRLQEMRQLFEVAAGPGTDSLQEHQFYQFIQEKKVQAYLSRIGLNVQKGNAHALFHLIDIDSSGSVGVSEFVEGCAQFIGTARQLDIARLRREVRAVAELVNRALSPKSGEPSEVWK